MPIRGVSNVMRLPRLGKIKLGTIVGEGDRSYPQAADHFICPTEVSQVYGAAPTELEVLFPVEDPSIFAQQWLRAYSKTQGLICIGDGISCRQKVDTKTMKPASHETEKWEWTEGLICDPQECPLYAKKHCRRVMNLQFLLPHVPGLGVWQIDTTSFYSIVNINSMLELVRSLCGRVAMVPLTLCIGPIEVSPPGIKKKTVYILHLKQDIRLADLQRVALTPGAQVLLPEPDVEEPPSDLFPDLAETPGPALAPAPAPAQQAPEPVQQAPAPARAREAPSSEQLEWGIIRTLQRSCNLEDAMIKSAFRSANPELKGRLRADLTDEVPALLTLPQLTAMRQRLEKYQAGLTMLKPHEEAQQPQLQERDDEALPFGPPSEEPPDDILDF